MIKNFVIKKLFVYLINQTTKIKFKIMLEAFLFCSIPFIVLPILAIFVNNFIKLINQSENEK